MSIHAGFSGFDTVICKCIGSHSYYRYGFGIRPVHCPYTACKLISVHDRHHDISNDCVILSRFRLLKELRSLLTVPCLLYNCAFLLKSELRNLHVELIILCKQDMPALNRWLGILAQLIILYFWSLVYPERNCHYKGCSHALLALKGKSTVHLFRKSLGDRHAQSGSRILRLRTSVLLCEGLKDFLLIFLAHAYACISADKFDYCPACIITRKLPAAYGYGAIFLIILDGIAQYVHKQSLDMQRAAYQIPMHNPELFSLKCYTLLHRKLIYDTDHLIQSIAEIERTAVKPYLT